MFENPRKGRQATNFTTNVPKILDLKSSSEQIFSENCRWVPLINFCDFRKHPVPSIDNIFVFIEYVQQKYIFSNNTKCASVFVPEK